MAGSNPISIRLSDEELALLDAVLHHYPDVDTRATLAKEMFLDGLYARAADATLPDLPLHGGTPPKTLAVVLERRLRGALAFLRAQGKLPLSTPSGGATPANPTPSPTTLAYADEAAKELDQLGADFLE